MARPVIAISGSADPGREYRKKLHRLDQAPEVCRELGRELAEAGWDLLVFSEDTGFVEPPVVEGYRSSAKAAKGTIRVRQPLDHPVTWESAPGGPRVVSEPVPADVGWEFPFYGGVLDADGLLLIGGARATRIAGVIALNRKIPVLPVTLFGGAAEEIWNELRTVGNDTDNALRAAMTGGWSPGSARQLVATLDEQRKRRAGRLRDEAAAAGAYERLLARRHLAGLALVAVAVAAGSFYYGWRLAGVVAIAMVAAAGGGLVSRQNPGRAGRRARAAAAELPTAVTLTRAAFAGLVTVLTYVVSQTLGAGPSDQLANGSITVFALVAGAVAGFTADRVLARIQPVEVGDLSRLPGVAAADVGDARNG